MMGVAAPRANNRQRDSVGDRQGRATTERCAFDEISLFFGVE
jgi:hypothetical protein